ncbi:tetratricopeptide repeat protein, partial [bacterium]|nr:tetratricopeptide repeat protein [bacterium]
MNKLTQAALLAFLALAFAGCGPSLVQRGDRAMLFQRPAAAAQFYVQALAENPKLATDPKFSAKLNRAQSLAHCAMGRELAAAGRWDEAVSAFRDAVQAAPDLPTARDGLAWAKREAAKVHLTSAFTLADKGKLDDALTELSTAAELDPQNPNVQRALAFARQEPSVSGSPAQALTQQALRFEQEKALRKMAAALDQALAADAHHLLARVARFRAHTGMAQAVRHVTAANTLLSAKRLDAAQAELKKALAIWPHYPEAADLLRRTRSQRAQAEVLAMQAKTLSDAGKWEETVRVASAALDVFPGHDQARALHEHARKNAAADSIASGRFKLKQGQLDDAEALFQQALGYVPDIGEAHAALAEIDGRRGHAAEQSGLWGNALIWHLRAADHFDTRETTDRIAIARAHILARSRFALDVTV